MEADDLKEKIADSLLHRVLTHAKTQNISPLDKNTPGQAKEDWEDKPINELQPEQQLLLIKRIAEDVFADKILLTTEINKQDVKTIGDIARQNYKSIKELKSNLKELKELMELKKKYPKQTLEESLANTFLESSKFNARLKKIEDKAKEVYCTLEDYQDLKKVAITKKEVDIKNGELRGQLNNLKGRIQDLTLQGRDFQTDIGTLRQMQGQSATQNDLQEVIKKLDGYAPLYQHEQVRDKMGDYVLVKDNEKFNKELEKTLDDLQIQVSKKQDAKDAENIEKDIRKMMNYKSSQALQKTDFQQDQKKQKEIQDKQFDLIEELQYKVRKINELNKEFEIQLGLKVNMEELEEYKRLVAQLPTIEDCEEMKRYMHSNIDEFRGDNDQFKIEHFKNCEIIRRYDQIIDLKASKIAMQQLRNDYNADLKKKIDETYEHIEVTRAHLRKDINRIDDFSQGLEEAVENTIQKTFKRERLKQGVAETNKDALSSDVGNSIKKSLLMKADKVDIEKLFEIKSNKIDTDNMLEVQEIMNKQFKHILILFIELLNLQHCKSTDTKFSNEKRTMNLLDQMQSLNNWVMRFNPREFIESADQATEQYMCQPDEQAVRDFTDQVLSNIKTKKPATAQRRVFKGRGSMRTSLEKSATSSLFNNRASSETGTKSNNKTHKLRKVSLMERRYTNADTDSMRTNEIGENMTFIVPLRQPSAYKRKQQGSLSPTEGQIDYSFYNAPTYLANVQSSNPLYNSTQVSDRNNVITETIPNKKNFTFGRNKNLVMSQTAANFFENVPLDQSEASALLSRKNLRAHDSGTYQRSQSGMRIESVSKVPPLNIDDQVNKLKQVMYHNGK